jgi:DNA-binding transcriptional LysR family regulator
MSQTQSALSKALKEAEAMLGCALFERTRRGLRPTREGRIVVRGAGLLLEELAHLERETLAARGRAEAVLRVGAPPFVALGWLPGVFQKLLRRDPPVHVRLTEERVPQLLESLLQGELDALLTTTPAELPAQAGARLRFEKLFEAEILVIAGSAHALAGRRSVGWAQLAHEPWVLPDRSAAIRRLADEMFLRAGIAPPSPVVESGNPLTNVKLVGAGLGLGMVPGPLALEAERAGSVRRLRPAPPIPRAPVALITRDVANPRVDLLREALSLAPP